jgi:hypothetical protein
MPVLALLARGGVAGRNARAIAVAAQALAAAAGVDAAASGEIALLAVLGAAASWVAGTPPADGRRLCRFDETCRPEQAAKQTFQQPATRGAAGEASGKVVELTSVHEGFLSLSQRAATGGGR